MLTVKDVFRVLSQAQLLVDVIPNANDRCDARERFLGFSTILENVVVAKCGMSFMSALEKMPDAVIDMRTQPQAPQKRPRRLQHPAPVAQPQQMLM